MMRFIFLIIGIVIFLVVFNDKVRPYTDPVVEKGKLVYETYLIPAYDFLQTKVKEFKESSLDSENKE